ncbi:IS3 family transposase [Pseudomonas xantholysinigenes]|uniref:IS3 family transposase n=1 Tax=Pseudomonas xantholysinigenes TaxID=2745490 RepID=A0A9E6PTC2_9PSED|nr:IS3 family transposase [Pseudomonas xantholysinigenes]QXI36337.1 IS3 family transposase [Pseudomonas xantholysinigenes]QXI36794.1 IS3 family transposase [Pseudomonas xantholysinigenes]QXI36931.1 IS3 family transposase [Pseudomonas xantholysinigenes]QXI37240.1 IS3 family transposase [Pseudomonas xantholysinigenes]QXI37282.1 IS3 family transposase [Pseudomonas xantholysinigenes]
MTKYDLALKQALIEECLSARSVHEVALRHSLSASLLRRWIKGYEQHGAAGLATKYSHYDAQFKLKVLQCIEQDGLSAQQACIQFDIRGPSSIRQWKRLYDEGGLEALHPHRARESSMPRKASEQPNVSPAKPADAELTPKQMLEELEYLRAENAYLKKLDALPSGSTHCATKKAQAVQGLRHEHRLALLLRAAGLARSTFYYQSKALVADKHAALKERIKSVYHRHKGRYGYRRITAVLGCHGEVINHKKVQRLMQLMDLKSLVKVKKYRSYRGSEGLVASDLLKREFKAEAPNQKWVTDVTEFKVKGQKLFLSPVMDLYNGEILAYQINPRPEFKMVSAMLEQAFERLNPDDKPILHSDQGWQYRQPAYRHMLGRKKIQQSMSRKGNCLDNAAMESFFGTLKSEFFYLQSFESVEQLASGLEDYIAYYNQERISLRLNGLSPVQFRTQALNP